MNLSDTSSVRNRIESKINQERAELIEFDAGGSMNFANAVDIMEFSKMMAVSGVAIPKHLRDSPGACMAIIIQASEWRMSPFAVANKSYSVNDRLAYESQLISAVILRRAPIVGRFKISYSGSGNTRRCKVSAMLEDGDTVEYESPEIGAITVKNSPLWKSDPDQQLYYFSSRSMCRRHFPDVLLGVYAADELADNEPTIRDVTPPNESPFLKAMSPQQRAQAAETASPAQEVTASVVVDPPSQEAPKRRGRPAAAKPEPPAAPVVEVETVPQGEESTGDDFPGDEPGAPEGETEPEQVDDGLTPATFSKLKVFHSADNAAKKWTCWAFAYVVDGESEARGAETYSSTLGAVLDSLKEGDRIRLRTQDRGEGKRATLEEIKTEGK